MKNLFLIHFIFRRLFINSLRNGFEAVSLWSSLVSYIFSIIVINILFSIFNNLENIQKIRLLSDTPHLVIYNLDNLSSIDFIKSINNDTTLNNLNYQPYSTTQVLYNNNSNLELYQLEGIDVDQSYNFDSKITYINNGKLDSGLYNIIVPRNLYREKYVMLTNPTVIRYLPVGKVPLQRKFNIIGVHDINDNVMIANINDVSIFANGKSINLSSVRFYLDDPYNIYTIEDNIKDKWVYNDWRDKYQSLFESIKKEKSIMLLLFSLLFIVSLFVNFSSFSLFMSNNEYNFSILSIINGCRLVTLNCIYIYYLLINIIISLFVSILVLYLIDNFLWKFLSPILIGVYIPLELTVKGFIQVIAPLYSFGIITACLLIIFKKRNNFVYILESK